MNIRRMADRAVRAAVAGVLCLVVAWAGWEIGTAMAASTEANATMHSRVTVVHRAGVARSPNWQRGLAVPQADITVDGDWEDAVAIPTGTVAIRVYTDQLVFLYADATDANSGALTGALVTPGCHHEIGCAGATKLHAGKYLADCTVRWTAVLADGD